MAAISLASVERSYHEFLRAAKLYWSKDMYAALHSDFANRGLMSKTVDEAEREMRETSGYQFFSWFERNLQKEKYDSRLGLVAIAERYRKALEHELECAKIDGESRGLLKLSPSLSLPAYYTKTDFHQHPGGVAGDTLAGFIYELGRRTTMPLHLDPFGLHDAFARVIAKGSYQKILDLGCGTGRSTFPFARLYPEAEVHGVDFSAPCLTLAHRTAHELGLPVKWSQQNAEHMNFEDGYFDLVHSTFLLHELPVKVIESITHEVWRVLRPGGVFANLDFHSPQGGTWGDFIHYGHGLRNNEVFMRSFCEFDYIGFQRSIGFAPAIMTPFDDGTGRYDRTDVPPQWRFPFQLFAATKPA